MGDVVPITTDPIKRARALLAQGREEFHAALESLRASQAARRADALLRGEDISRGAQLDHLIEEMEARGNRLRELRAKLKAETSS